MIRISPIFRSSCRSFSSLMIWACTVTSSAVVGSSAISTAGSSAMAIAIMIRCRIPPENWCGKALTRCRAPGICTRSISRDGPVQRVGLVHAAVLAEHLRDLPAHREHRVQRGQRVLEDHRDLGPADLPATLVGQLEDVGAAVAHLAAGDVAGRGVEDSHDRLGGHRLARPGLAEDGQGLALVAGRRTPR